MTKDDPKDQSNDRKHNPSKSKDTSFYDVSYDYPMDANDASHSDSLSSNQIDSEKYPTPDNSSKWDNFHADFQEKQRQQYDKQPDEDEVSKYATEQTRKVRSAALEEQIKHEQLEDEASKSSLMLDRSIRRVRSLFTDFDSFTPPASNPYKSDVHGALKQRESTSYEVSPKQSTLDSVSSSPELTESKLTSNWRERLKKRQDKSLPTSGDDDVREEEALPQIETSDLPSTWHDRRQQRQENPLANQSELPETSDSFINDSPSVPTEEILEDLSQAEVTRVQKDNPEAQDVKTSVSSDSGGFDQDQTVNAPFSQEAPHKRRYSSDLPSPEEIAQERERRRKLRIQQLEAMSSDEEIEQSYQGDYTPRSSPSTNRNSASTNDPSFISEQTHDEPKVEIPSLVDDFMKQHAAPQIEETEVATEADETFAVNQPISTEDTEIERFIEEEDEKQLELEEEVEVEGLIVTDGESDLSNDSATETPETDLTDQTPEVVQVEVISEINEEPGQIEVEEEVIIEEELIEDTLDSEDVDATHLEIEPTAESSDSHLIDLETVAIGTGIIAASDQDLNAANMGVGSPVLPDSSHQAATGAELLNLEDTSIPFSQRDDVSIQVIHEPLETDPGADAYEHATAEDPVVLSDVKNKKQLIYSLENYSLKEKVLFGINVAFNVFKRMFFYIVLIAILFGAMAAGAGAGFFANLVSKTPPPTHDEMLTQVNRLEQQSTLYYANGEPIANIRADVVRSVANIDGISSYIIDGLIATEDEDFFEHPGVMPKAILRAALETILTGGGTGGSTLTQQLVKQQMLSHDVTFFRKANEILLALRLENHLSKDEILTAYLNVSPFGRNNNGDNVAGILKASEGIFGLEPDAVNLAQAAFLVGLPQDPYAYTPYDQYGEFIEDFQPGINRMHEVLFRMYRDQKITQAEYETALEYDITKDFLPQEPREEQRQSYLYQAMMSGAIEEIMHLNIEADGFDWKQVYEDDEWYNEYYFAAEEELRTGGYRVYTTIDRQIYDQLQVSAQTHDDQLGVTYDGVFVDPETGEEIYYLESVQTGMVVIDNRSGKVLGFVSGTDYENNQIDHAFGMRRSPGSTIKPLAVYGPAIEENLITPATIIPDTEFVRQMEDGTEYRPTNYGNVVSDTYFSARTALLRSDNIPAVRIYEELLNRRVPVVDYLEKMGFNTVDSYTDEATQNLSFALGGITNGPTVFEQTRAFSTFANNGSYVDSYFIERIEDSFGNIVFQQDIEPVQVFSEDSNYLVVDMLRDTTTEGSGRTAGENLAVGGDWIAKSGISEESKDIWFIGSTPAITIGSWIGYDSRYAEHTFDINDGFDREAVRSQTYWARIVNDLYALRPEIFGAEQTFAQPESVQTQTILSNTGTLPGNVTVNNRQYNVSTPTSEDVFKTSHPAPALNFNFMFGATDEDHQRFWTQFQQAADTLRQQQQQQQQQSSQESSSSSESSSSESSSSDENSSTNDETPADESAPPAENPEG